MITLPELLKDQVYKRYFLQNPKLPLSVYAGPTPPWRVLARLHSRDGKWVSINYEKYVGAFGRIKTALREEDLIDGAIVCRRMQFKPPTRTVRIKGKYFTNPAGERVQVTQSVVWKPKLDPVEPWHNWCPYCRRPTIFNYFGKHHALPAAKIGKGVDLDSSVLRCSICGASERLVTLK